MTTTPLVPEQPGGSEPALEQTNVSANDNVHAALERGREAAERVGEAVTSLVGKLRNSAELDGDRGTTTIADEVVGKIAGIAAREVQGVYDLGGDTARVFASLKERIGLSAEGTGEDSDRGVRVRLEGTNAVVDMTIVIEFGYVVHTVTDAVRTKVISSVETMLGLEVTAVNIRVDDVHVADSGALTP
jgi:uncharacterized alkaline shock family protein YloU